MIVKNDVKMPANYAGIFLQAFFKILLFDHISCGV